jgi:hypothetical protein
LKTLLLAIFLSLPAYSYAQVLATVPVMADGNHTAHDYSFGPILVPAKATLVRVVFDSRDRLTGEQTLTVVLERSFNGGASYEPAGGQVFDAVNQPADFVVALPQPTNIARVLGGRITLFDGRWKGKASIEIE